MSSIEVLVATMNQTDLRKYNDMNIKTDVIFANQSDKYDYVQEVINNNRVRMITTNSIGVGINRNQALLLSNADICLLSDDDMRYCDNYAEIIETAFDKIPDADIIIFNIITVGGKVYRRTNNKIGKVGIYNFLNYGAARIAFRRESIIKSNIWFSLLFGGGALYSSGEDTIFLRDALRKKLRIYTYPAVIGTVMQESSTWFSGYNEKYFFNRGALLSAIFPLFKYLIGIVYYPLRFHNKTSLGKREIIYYIISGIKSYSKCISYDKWMQSRKNERNN